MSNLSSQPPSGQTRSLTEVFILLRNNAVQSRHIFASNSLHSLGRTDDKMSLIPLNEDVESSSATITRAPPEWVSIVDEVHYELSRVRTRMRELKDLQQQHLNRPSFSDENTCSESEQRIETATNELTRMLSHCHKLIQHIEQHGAAARRDGARVLRNTVTSLLMSVQTATEDLRTAQTAYLKNVRARDDSVQRYFTHFDSAPPASDVFASSSYKAPAAEASNEWPQETSGGAGSGGEISMAQLQAIEMNEDLVKQREKDVLHITQSIVELNTLFKGVCVRAREHTCADVANVIADQGTILDRIDFNIEQTDVRVKSAAKSVLKAEQYQRKHSKILCIIILACAIIFFLFLLLMKL